MNKSIYTDQHKSLVHKLKKARKESGVTQKQVAKLLGKTQSHISKIECGQRRIDITQLQTFASIYKKDITYFIRS